MKTENPAIYVTPVSIEPRILATLTVADLEGAPPPTDQNFFNFIGFSENTTKILGRRPSRDWHPLLGEVLDPPLT